MADSYLKLELRGTAVGQNIRNILYYGDDVGAPIVGINTAFLEQFNGEWAEAYAVGWTVPYPSSYTLDSIVASAVDERGAALDMPFMELQVGEAGVQNSDTDSVAICAIMKITTIVQQDIAVTRPVRSYVAVGPISSLFVNNDGGLTSAALTQLATIPPILAGSVVVGALECTPVRIGRTVSPAPVSVGRVFSVSIQPYTSFRRSRKRRPNGT